MMLARFTRGDETYVVASLHLHSGLLVRTRRKEIGFIKSHIERYAHATPEALVVFGGDFNDGAPWEKKTVASILASEYKNVTTSIRYTLNSLYSEPAGNGINEISWLLARFGIGMSIKVDHIYTNAQTALTKAITCRTLPLRVSDHSPIEVIIR
jgi:endonuclease/exonuclease/phosphatase family metal-dependent hydrolase